MNEERVTYFSNQFRARSYQNQYLSLIIDGADQAKYGLPYFFLKSKASDKGYKLKNKLYGVLAHGRQHGRYWIPN